MSGLLGRDKIMPEIAYTNIGRNALFAGLICHIAAFLVGMLSASGMDCFFCIVFFLSCFFLVAGAYAELKQRGCRPLRAWRFHVSVVVAALPLLGPFIVFALLYDFQKSGQEKRGGLFGLFPAIFRLKANVLVISLLLVLLVILFVFTNSRDDPYYKKRDRYYRNGNLPQSLSDAGHYKSFVERQGLQSLHGLS
jgi:hypothetical protein